VDTVGEKESPSIGGGIEEEEKKRKLD